jgi:hypothetical protein
MNVLKNEFDSPESYTIETPVRNIHNEVWGEAAATLEGGGRRQKKFIHPLPVSIGENKSAKCINHCERSWSLLLELDSSSSIGYEKRKIIE